MGGGAGRGDRRAVGGESGEDQSHGEECPQHHTRELHRCFKYFIYMSCNCFLNAMKTICDFKAN